MPSTLLLPPNGFFRISYGPSENENAEIKKTSLKTLVQPWLFFDYLVAKESVPNQKQGSYLTCGSVFQQLYISELHLSKDLEVFKYFGTS